MANNLSVRNFLQRNQLKSAFQYVSDLHLEVGQQYLTFDIPVCAPYLVLAGDIGRLVDYPSYLLFLERQCAHFELVFLVLGNHEFYGASRQKGLESAAALEKEPSLNGKLRLLNRSRVDLAGSNVTILGCTLHSNIAIESWDIINNRLKDFKLIEGWTIDDHIAEHELDLSWLKTELESIKEKYPSSSRTVLIITHHAPTTEKSSSPENFDNLLGTAFGTDILKNNKDATGVFRDVKWWIFGHTHYTTEFEMGGTRVVANQRGYVFHGLEEKYATKRGFWHWVKISSQSKHEFDVRRVLNV